jgi:hypothetical protein
MRRGAAWPARWPSSRLVVREHKLGWGLSVWSLGVAAKEVRMPAVLSSPCPRSCPASGVQCPVRASGVPRVPVQVTGVWCGRLRVQVSSVRRPASVRPASAVSDGMRSRGVAVGPAAARLGWPGAAWSPAMSMTARRLPEVGAWRSKLAQAVLGQRRVDLDLVVVGGGWQWARPTEWPTGRGWMRARIAHREAAGGDHAAWSSCEAWA